MILELDINNCIDDSNLTAEKYMKLHPSERLILNMKWAKEELENDLHTHVDEKRKQLHKPLEKVLYRIYVLNNDGLYYEFDSLSEVSFFTGMSKEVVDYLFRYRNKEVKNPKFNEYYTYRLETVEMILKGNKYIVKGE